MSNKTSITVSAPCKIHLLGEHAAVYGKPALLVSVNKRCKVTITKSKNTNITITSYGIEETLTVTEKQILSQTKKANKTWGEFAKTNDISLLKSITKHPLDYVVIAIGEALLYYKKKLPSGFDIHIASDVPVGSGLGSSAAIGVTIAGALTAFLELPFDKEHINNIAYNTEHKKNGFPSGGDNAAICYGGLVWFRKETSTFKIIQPLSFTIPSKLAKNFVIVGTGKPEESTGEMVSAVRSLRKENPTLVDGFLKEQEALTQELIAVIKDGKEEDLMRIIKTGEKNLEKIGVVSDYVCLLIKKIEKVGGAAKISGAGGKTKGAGMLLAYHKNPNIIKEIIKKVGLSYFQTNLGVEGLRIE